MIRKPVFKKIEKPSLRKPKRNGREKDTHPSGFKKLMQNSFFFGAFCIGCFVAVCFLAVVAMSIIHPYSDKERQRKADYAVRNSGWGSTPSRQTYEEYKVIHDRNNRSGNYTPEIPRNVFEAGEPPLRRGQ